MRQLVIPQDQTVCLSPDSVQLSPSRLLTSSFQCQFLFFFQFTISTILSVAKSGSDSWDEEAPRQMSRSRRELWGVKISISHKYAFALALTFSICHLSPTHILYWSASFINWSLDGGNLCTKTHFNLATLLKPGMCSWVWGQQPDITIPRATILAWLKTFTT